METWSSVFSFEVYVASVQIWTMQLEFPSALDSDLTNVPEMQLKTEQDVKVNTVIRNGPINC